MVTRLVSCEVLKDAQFEAVAIVPNTYHHPQRDIDTVVHGDDFVAVAEDDHLNFLERVLENSMEIKRVGRIGPGRSSAGKVLKRVVSWTGDGFTWEADPRLLGKLLKLLNLTEGKGATVPGAKDVGKDDRDVNKELEYAEANVVQAAAGLEQYIALDRPDHCLQRQDSTATDVETHEVDEASNHQGCSVLKEQSKVGLEIPVSTAAEEH